MSAIGDSKIIAEAALTWHDTGCSIIPIRADGTKKPVFDWKSNMTKRMSRELVTKWWINNPAAGIGIVCGTVSGNLEMLELEGRAATGDDITKIDEQCQLRGVGPLFRSFLDTGYAEWTPSGGLHFLYRITDHDVPGNTKIARRLATPEELADKPGDRFKVLSETRGEGGYLVVAPSAGAVHATGDSWSVAAGQLGVIPAISWDDRCKLHEAIHAALDAMPAAPTPAPRPLLSSLLPSATDRPGDDYNQRT
jgi:putative DNA primase/helicase